MTAKGTRARASVPRGMENIATAIAEPAERNFALGRLGTPEDCGGPIVFFASDMSRYCTGSALLVDGGLFVNLQ